MNNNNDLSINDYIIRTKLQGIDDVLDPGQLWKPAPRGDKGTGDYLFDALDKNKRSQKIPPNIEETHYAHIVLYISEPVYYLDVTKNQGVALKALEKGLQKLHKDNFSGMLVKGLTSKVKVMPKAGLSNGEIEFVFGSAIHIADAGERERQQVSLTLGDAEPVVIGSLFSNQDLCLLSSEKEANASTHQHWPYEKNEGLIVLASQKDKHADASPIIVSVPLHKFKITLKSTSKEAWHYSIEHKNKPTATLVISRPERHTQSIPKSPYSVKKSNMTADEITITKEVMERRQQRNVPLTVKQNSAADLSGTYINPSLEPQQTNEQFYVCLGFPLHRLSQFSEHGVHSLNLPLAILQTEGQQKGSLIITVADEIYLQQNGIQTPIALDKPLALEGGLMYYPLPSVVQTHYLGWVRFPIPVLLPIPSDEWQRVGRGSEVDIAPAHFDDPSLLNWQNGRQDNITPEQLNFSRHQLDLRQNNNQLQIRAKGRAPIYHLNQQGRVVDILRSDKDKITALDQQDYIITGSYVLAPS